MKQLLFSAIIWAAAAVCGRCMAQQPEAAPVLVNVADLDSSIVFDIRYATSDNFVGSRVDGYEEPLCLLSEPAAEALVQAHRELISLGYGLVVFDCYRPQRAADHFVRWARYPREQSTKGAYYPRVEKKRLFKLGYISSRSGHSRASTVDVGLVRFGEDSTGSEMRKIVDMGTPFDFFDPLSHTDADGLKKSQRRHRDLLRDVLSRHRFRNYAKEWWHFTLRNEPYRHRYFDVVVSRQSASERVRDPN